MGTDRFPQEYWQIVEIVGEQEQTLRIGFKQKNRAHNLRQRLYRFRNEAIKELPKTVDGMENPKILALDALYITIEEPSHEDPQWYVVVTPRSMTPDAVVIRDAVKKLMEKEEEFEKGS